MNVWEFVWISIIGAGLIAEAVAYFGFNKTGDATLSQKIWKWFAVKDDRKKAAPFRRWALRIIMVLLAAHFGWNFGDSDTQVLEELYSFLDGKL